MNKFHFDLASQTIANVRRFTFTMECRYLKPMECRRRPETLTTTSRHLIQKMITTTIYIDFDLLNLSQPGIIKYISFEKEKFNLPAKFKKKKKEK